MQLKNTNFDSKLKNLPEMTHVDSMIIGYDDEKQIKPVKKILEKHLGNRNLVLWIDTRNDYNPMDIMNKLFQHDTYDAGFFNAGENSRRADELLVLAVMFNDNRNNIRYDETVIYGNKVKNLAYVPHSLSFRELRELYQTERAIVWLSGASLDGILEKVDVDKCNNALNICIESTWKKISDAGIRVDWICSCEPIDTKLNCCAGYDRKTNACLVVPAEFDNESLGRYWDKKNPLYITHGHAYPYSAFAKTKDNITGHWVQHVGAYALNQALSVASQVCLVGSDLCFEPGAGYMKGLPHLQDGRLNEASELKVRCYDGEERYTRKDFQAFGVAHAIIAKVANKPVFNAAKIAGKVPGIEFRNIGKFLFGNWRKYEPKQFTPFNPAKFKINRILGHSLYSAKKDVENENYGAVDLGLARMISEAAGKEYLLNQSFGKYVERADYGEENQEAARKEYKRRFKAFMLKGINLIQSLLEEIRR